jgi:hypothetical protein
MFGAVVLVFPAIAVVDAALAAEPAATQPTATQPAATAQTIAQWINELGSDSYTVREGASDELVQAGRAAIDATVAATQKDDLEVTTRAVQILAAMLKSRDIETADAAAAALGKVAAVRNASTAAMAAAGIATDALADYDQVRQERTLAEIKRLGGSVATGIGMTGNPDGVQVMLESGWHGGSAGFKLLKHVPSLERLAVHSVAMTDADLSLLDGLPRLASLEIFGTKVSLAASQKFAQAHPGVRVDRRSNAKLGIMGENGSCKIALVQPGSAAEQAGLLPEDVILKFQGRAVNDFATLTAEIGSCEAGDKVTVEVSRDGETLKKVVMLGAW